MHRPTTTGLLILLSLITSASARAAEETYQLKVVTDRKNAIYEAGEQARFLVTLTRGDQPVTSGTIMSVGFIDSTCPPSSCYAAYNQLLGEKRVINEPLMGHAAPKHIHDAFFERVLEHVRSQTAPSESGVE